MSNIVFLSSTCYDLIDLRSELEEELKAMKLTPILSDRPSSEFRVIPDKNSIENCLVNVRKCGVFIIILSQRYGPSLKKAGFPDLSATHLEYLEAKRTKKPIYMYVRDRLESDYNIWRKNAGKNVSLSWVKKGDEKIFSLLKEHRNLANRSKKSNWIWTFRDSVELRKRIRDDLRATAGKSIIQNLLNSGHVALLLPEVNNWDYDSSTNLFNVKITVRNVGTAVAIQPLIKASYEEENDKKSVNSIIPGSHKTVLFKLRVPQEIIKKKAISLFLECGHTTLEGHVVTDESNLYFSWGKTMYENPFYYCGFVGKKYYHSAGIKIKTAK